MKVLPLRGWIVMTPALLLLSGCVLAESIGTTNMDYRTGSATVTATSGDLPDLGTMSFKEGGRLYGWPIDEDGYDGTNGSTASFVAENGWELVLRRFGQEGRPPGGDVMLGDPSSDDPGYLLRCVPDQPLVTTDTEFSGTLTCDGERITGEHAFSVVIDFAARS